MSDRTRFIRHQDHVIWIAQKVERGEVSGDPVAENALPTSETVFIEHYLDGARGTPEDPAAFDLLTFGHTNPEPVMRAVRWSVELGEPIWSPLDRESVERLIGAPVD